MFFSPPKPNWVQSPGSDDPFFYTQGFEVGEYFFQCMILLFSHQ
jgi:hypothetical protein